MQGWIHDFFPGGRKKVYDMEHFHEKHVLLSREACFPGGLGACSHREGV